MEGDARICRMDFYDGKSGGRVLRDDSWSNNAPGNLAASHRDPNNGFRCALMVGWRSPPWLVFGAAGGTQLKVAPPRPASAVAETDVLRLNLSQPPGVGGLNQG